jgi:hypothetical protein
MGFRFEFDPANKILLMRFEGLVTDESLAESYAAVRKYSVKTDARAGIWDFSSVTEHGESSETIRELAIQEPAMPDPTRPRFVVTPGTNAFGLARMFQIVGGRTRPLLQVVRAVDEALAALGVQSPNFEPLE